MITTDNISGALNEYRKQLNEVQAGLDQLENNYKTQKELGINTYNQLAGAVRALEILIEEDQKREAEKQAAEAQQKALPPIAPAPADAPKE